MTGTTIASIGAGGAALLGVGGQVASSLIASSSQQSAANTASNTQLQMLSQEQQLLAPYTQTGYTANTALNNLTGAGTANPLTSPLLKPITMDQATLQTTPGYQFNLQQGLESVQNSAAARGLGSSGAALKGAANYATGLADSTYQNQYNNALTNQNNQFNRLLGLTQLGQTSAAGVGSAGITTGQGIASNTIGAGNAAAAGAIGVGNAVSSAYPNYLANNALSNIYGQNTNNSNNLTPGGYGAGATQDQVYSSPIGPLP